jgi:hypothetical protein
MNWFIETMDVYGHTVLHNDPIVAAELRTARAAVTTAGVRTPVYGHTALHNDPVIAAQLREAQNTKSTVVHTHMRGSGGRLNYNDTSVMQAMSKRLRALQRSTLSRKDRSAVYDDAVLLMTVFTIRRPLAVVSIGLIGAPRGLYCHGVEPIHPVARTLLLVIYGEC